MSAGTLPRRVKRFQPGDEGPGSVAGSGPIDFNAFLASLEGSGQEPRGCGHIHVTVERVAAVSVTHWRESCGLGQVRVKATAVFDKTVNTVRQTLSYKWSSRSLSELLGDRFAEGGGEDDAEGEGELRIDTTARKLHLSVPLSLTTASGRLAEALGAWAGAATRSLAGSAAATFSASLSELRAAAPDLVRMAPVLLASAPVAQALRSALFASVSASMAATGAVPAGSLPLLLSGFGGLVGFLEGEEEVATKALSTHVGLFSLTSAIMFIASIRGLNKHSTSQEGNIMGMVATALSIVSVLVSPGFNGAHLRFFVAFTLAAIVGYGAASQVSMEDMPQLVAGFHSFVGLAAVFAGFASYFHTEPFHALKALETCLGTAVGMLTFTGSVVAAGKLHGVIPGRPIILDSRWTLNILGLLSSVGLTGAFCTAQVYGSSSGLACLAANTFIWAGLGANMVLPIGGADMPVVVSLLNAFSGIATSAMGFMLGNNLLTITGALVASSGALLSDIMCRGINRSMTNVLLGGFGVEDGGVVAPGAAAATGTVTEVSAMGFVGMLLNAKRVVIVPGYGLAVARCQQRLAEIVAILRSHGVVVHFAIHPVAGRLPGHMNVLLAEADVPYDIVKEMEEVKRDLPQYDVAIVVGANDIVNPATQEDTSSPIYGMPAIEVWECKTCVVLKRSMATGYSGVDNPLFYRPNVRMLFGDAKHSLDTVHHLLEESQDRIAGGAPSPVHQEMQQQAVVQEEFPPAVKVVGVIRERRQSERRVSVAPSVVPVLRRMGFSILLEAGAGVSAGFADEDFLRRGGVNVAESRDEVLQQADVILKVNEPLLEEVRMLRGSQTMVGFWNMYNTQELLDALSQSQASFINLALVPRISRAQKLDALSSMANIAGYRAVLDAFNRLPRFSRSSVTACGASPPARVFVIGAGVAGLSAIATAHAMGAKVYANDVREAAREQVESLGAEFIAVDAQGITGEGAGGYATVMGQAFQDAQLATYARVIPDMDVVITTAMIPNREAPELIPEEVVRNMRKGSVIVDLAAQSGGNCRLTRVDQTIVSPTGVIIIGETNYPSTMAAQASELIGNNFAALLDTLGGAGNFGGEHWEDAIIRPATIVHQGQVKWPPPPPAASAAPSAQPPAEAGPARPPPPPEEASEIIKWLQEHQKEIAYTLGSAVLVGLGFTTEIPEQELTHMGYFILSLLIGHFTVASVTPALHTPLIAVTNAISGIIVVGGMLQLSGPLVSARVGCALAAVFLSSINIVGGFLVTRRMLDMFREDAKRAVAPSHH